METQCLLSHYKLIQALTSYQLAREREAIDILAEDSEDVFGLPPPPVHKHPVSLSGDKHVLIQSHLLEFCNSLCVVSSLPAAIGWALNELVCNRVYAAVRLPPLHVHCRLTCTVLKPAVRWLHSTTSYWSSC